MVDNVAEFRRVVAQRRKQGTCGRYSEAMRCFGLSHAGARMRRGASVQTVASELGLGVEILASWLGATSTRERSAQLVPVTVKREAAEAHEAPRAPIVIVVGEVRVEVADASTAAEVVRRLR